MQSVTKLVLISIVVVIAPLSFALAKGEDRPANVAALPADAATESCKQDFSAVQLQDPNGPCFAQIKASLDPKVAEGTYLDRSLVKKHADDCGDCHIQDGTQVAADTVHNIYNNPHLKSAVESTGTGTNDGTDGGNAESGRDQ